MAHEIITVPALGEAVGFAHGVAAGPGRTVYLGGQPALEGDGVTIHGETLPEQFDRAAANVITALRAAGGEAPDICVMQIFVCDIADYKRHRPELGRVWRTHFGRHYPAIGLFEISGLYDDGALVELMATAVVPARG